ncbi:hypothetical protein K492DRAFT_205415 [Lichtheimia hyalospora FSU 10163]|nr:hypothetical protein K492DRAFT_205415 [Lichtheimia hyalospora FSU 10163]
MALFSNALDLKCHLQRPTPKLAFCSFVASAKSSEVLAQSGHLAVSAPSQIIGRFQQLKTLSHDNLCEYVEIHRGKHDRLFVVTEYYDQSLQDIRNTQSSPVSISTLQHYAREIFSALAYLQQHNIIHAALSPHNVMLTDNNHIKLCGYGLYHMTGHATDVEFPIGYPSYMSPESVLDENPPSIYHDKRDCWAVGVMLLEQYCRSSFWTTSDVGLIFDSLATLNEWANDNENYQQTIWNHSDIATLDINKDVLLFLQGNPLVDDNSNNDSDIQMFRQFILDCLEILPSRRPTLEQILAQPMFNTMKNATNHHPWVSAPIIASEDLDPERESLTNEKPTDVLCQLPVSHIYHLWRLAGGDVELNLVKRGVFLSMPVIERLPRVGFVDNGTEIGSVTVDTTQLYSDTMHILSFKELYQRLEEGKRSEHRFEWDTDYFTVVDENDVNFLADGIKETMTFDHEEDDLDDDLIFNDEPTPLATPAFGNGPLSSTMTTSPTTPSTSRSLNRTFSLTSMTRSRSSSSLSVGTPPPSTPTLPTQPSIPPRRPLSLREQDVNYQHHRQLLFSQLLRQYPASRKEILHHAKVDIPPVLRGKIWAAILGVRGDVQSAYDKIDKYNDITSDRQIDVDVPRCHQYNQLLASSVGHDKLRRLLKAWVSSNKSKNWVYWQGLDSLCAPFLTLNFNDEAVAFECLQKFILKFLNNFFLKDSKPVLDDYFAVFRHLLSFHDPELSAHIDAIGFMPDLYAIRWFLTLFTHVFPLDKVYHLWDKFVVGPASLPLFVGVAILRQIRDDLLKYEFNGCISLFSENFPKIDIERCIQSAMNMCKVTPPSIVAMQPISPSPTTKSQQDWWDVPLSIDIRKQELAPRIAMKDFPKIAPYTLVLDIRSDKDFASGHVVSSMNVQAPQLPSYASILKKLNRKYHVVIGDDQEAPQFATELLQEHRFPRTVVLHGGIEAAERYYKNTGNRQLCTCRPQKQTTTSYKGKGSEPPFVIWRCKVPTPLYKR